MTACGLLRVVLATADVLLQVPEELRVVVGRHGPRTLRATEGRALLGGPHGGLDVAAALLSGLDPREDDPGDRADGREQHDQGDPQVLRHPRRHALIRRACAVQQGVQRQGEPIQGADDGASGVAVLLELARQESLNPSGKALDFIFFDLEDGGQSEDEDSWCLGSQYWAQHPHQSDYKAKWGILLDMVGSQGARFYWEGLSREYARPLLSALWQTAAQLGWGDYFVQANGGQMTDDHGPVIRYRGIPFINFDPNRATGFGAHWHTSADNMNVIHMETLRAVGETVATTIREDI